jgi:hypothetical protein
VVSYLGKDGCSKRIWVPKGLAKKHSKFLANYIDDSDGPQELKWSDLWNDYIQGGKANSGSTLESLRVNGNCEVSSKSGLDEPKSCESRKREQSRVIEAGTSDPCQDDLATLQEPDALIDVSMPPNQQVKSGECPPSEHQGTHLQGLEGYDSVLGEMIAIQFRGMSMEVGKSKIVASKFTEFPGPQLSEQDRSVTVHHRVNAVSGSQVNSSRLPRDVEQIILQEIQDGGIDVSGMDLSEDFKDMIASEGKKQHVDHLKREEYTKDDIWEVLKVFSKWLVTGRIVSVPYTRPSSTTGPSYTLDLGEILWHGRMFMSKEFTATMHRTIKREGAICTHTFNPSKLNTMRLAKWMYDAQVEAYFESVEAKQAMRAKDAAIRREAEKRAQEARDEEAERAVNPNLDAVLAIDNLGKKEATTPLTTHELPEISLTSLTSRSREIPSLYRPGGEINKEITPSQRRVPIVGASYDSDVVQGPRTRNTAAIPRTQRRVLPVQGTHHRGGLLAPRNRCHSPDCRHRRDRPSRECRHSQTSKSHASGEPRSHYRKTATPQNTPQLGRVRREERYSD